MGLKNRDSNIKYIRLKEGKFYVGKELDTPYEELEGVITNMFYRNEKFEGQELRKLIILIKDGDDTYQIGINVESQNYSSLVSFLKGADITQKLTLHPKLEVKNVEGKEIKRYSILVSQDGTYMKGYFTKDSRHDLPEWKIIKVGNKKVTDKTDYLEYLEKFVTNNYISKIKDTPTITDEEPDEEPVAATTESLPWEN